MSRAQDSRQSKFTGARPRLSTEASRDTSTLSAGARGRVLAFCCTAHSSRACPASARSSQLHRKLRRHIFYNWLFGLVAWFSLRVREVLGSIPRTALCHLGPQHSLHLAKELGAGWLGLCCRRSEACLMMVTGEKGARRILWWWQDTGVLMGKVRDSCTGPHDLHLAHQESWASWACASFVTWMMEKAQQTCAGPRLPKNPDEKKSGTHAQAQGPPKNPKIFGNFVRAVPDVFQKSWESWARAWILHFVHQDSWGSWACAGCLQALSKN